MDILERVIVPDLARQGEADQYETPPIPFIDQDAGCEEQFLEVDQAHNWDLVLHLACNSHVFAVLGDVLFSWHRYELVLIENKLIILHSYIEMTKLGHHELAHLMLRDINEAVLDISLLFLFRLLDDGSRLL